MAFCILWLLTAAATLRYYRLAMTDPLTGLYNRRALDSKRRFYAGKKTLTALYFDLDHLKQVNDQQGHSRGDQMLIRMARALESCCAKGDRVFRLGGDEFLIVSSCSGPEEILSRWEARGEAIPATVGISSGPGTELDALIARAEQAMYVQRKQKKERNP